MSVRFCGHCGEDLGADPHVECERSLQLEPPRFCGRCRRRMLVQVIPTGWSARCSAHGELGEHKALRGPADGTA